MKLRNSNLIKQNRVDIKTFANNLLNVSNKISASTKKREIVN